MPNVVAVSLNDAVLAVRQSLSAPSWGKHSVMSLYVFAPAAAGAAAAGAAVGPAVVAGAPQLASMASARNATMIVEEILEAVIDSLLCNCDRRFCLRVVL